jgi:hypothetical protein
MSKDTVTMPPPHNLPAGWDSYYSAEYSRLYFVNPLTGRSTWDLPTVDIHNDKFMFPIRDRDRSIRTPLPLSHKEKNCMKKKNSLERKCEVGYLQEQQSEIAILDGTCRETFL